MLSTKLKEAAGNSADATLYVDDVFSTYLYTGNGSTQTITNGIDLAGKGGMVWIKNRVDTNSHILSNTVSGIQNYMSSDLTSAQSAGGTDFVSSTSATGFSIGVAGSVNWNTNTYASWTFRKAAKFFDVVTYTGNGVAGRAIHHNLGVAPGMIFVKSTTYALGWPVYHRSNPATSELYLNATTALSYGGKFPTTPTSSEFYISSNDYVNKLGETYVAYLFAHDTSSTGIIQCGSFTDNGSGTTINLGWEPQYILTKGTAASNWTIIDTMRGLSYSANAQLYPNSSADEGSDVGRIVPTATGFRLTNYVEGPGATVIYMAIRRPNKPPTTGTQVFGLNARTGTGANATVAGGQTDDAVLIKNRGAAVADLFSLRLTGTGYLVTSSTAAEVAAGTTILQANPWDVMDGVKVGTTSTITNASANTFINYFFKRAPGFFDEVCYTGTGVANSAFAHNLGVTPEMMIFKRRNGVFNWSVYHKNSYTPPQDGLLVLNLDSAVSGSGEYFGVSGPTSTNFYLNLWNPINASSGTYVAYLFATLAGISKVGSYTGNGTGQAIACGFGSGGARFVLIKRTDSTGDWYTFDSVSGLTSGSSPYVLLNSTAAEVTGNNGVYASTGGFTLGSTASTTTNISGASYIYLSVA